MDQIYTREDCSEGVLLSLDDKGMYALLVFSNRKFTFSGRCLKNLNILASFVSHGPHFFFPQLSLHFLKKMLIFCSTGKPLRTTEFATSPSDVGFI